MLVGRPDPNRQSLAAADLAECLGQTQVVLGRQFDPQQHGKQALLVVIVHLDLGDVGPLTGHVMDDRVGQAAVVGSDGGNHDLHGALFRGCVQKFSVPTGCRGALNYRIPAPRAERSGWPRSDKAGISQVGRIDRRGCLAVANDRCLVRLRIPSSEFPI